MNTTVTSRDAILDVCRALVSEKGLSAINMRVVADACHVALGTLYYYFPSKEDLLIATIESVWEHIFYVGELEATHLSFPAYIERWFEHIQQGTNAYPHFFTMHSLSFASTGQAKAHETMARYLSHIRKGMQQSLHADSAVCPQVFSDAFTEADFIDFVLSHMLSMLMQQQKDCRVFLEVVRRTIY